MALTPKSDGSGATGDESLGIEAFQAVDRIREALSGQLSGGVSPGSLMMAYVDWAFHLAQAPGKQMELGVKAGRKWQRLMAHLMASAMDPQAAPVITPLPGDRRFAGEAWAKPPFSWMSQAFLLQQQWLHNVTHEVPGVTKHHEDVVSFAAKQILDVCAPSNNPFTNPEVVARTWATGGMNLVKGWQNWLQDVVRQIRQEPPEGVEAFTPGRDVAVTPGKVIFRNHLIELIQYTPTTETVHPEPVLIVPAWIMKYYILDLSPENSLIRWLVAQGHTVFAISWRNPGAEDRDLTLEDYRRLGVMAALDEITRLMPDQKIHATGYCLGGTLLSIAAAAMAGKGDARLASLTLLAAQVDFAEPGELALFIDPSQLHLLESMMWNRGYLSADQMAGAFQLLRSNDLIWSRMVRDYMMGERTAMNDLMAWNADSTRMPYRMHAEYLRRLYLNNELSSGRFTAGGKTVLLQNIRVGIMRGSSLLPVTRAAATGWRPAPMTTRFCRPRPGSRPILQPRVRGGRPGRPGLPRVRVPPPRRPQWATRWQMRPAHMFSRGDKMTGTLTNYLFHQMKIGDRASLVRHVGPKDIELFAAVSGDANPAHLDAGFAAHGPFGHVVVHGMWTAALISAVLGTRLPGPGTIYLDQQIRFNKPVSPGDTITAEVEVAELIEGKNRVRLTTTARNQRGEVVLSGEALVLAPVEQVTWVPGDLPEAVVLPKGRWQGFVEEARALPPVRAAVVHPCSKSAILGAIEVRDEGLLDPILIGPGAKIRAAAAEAGVSLDGFRIEETEHSHAAAARAVELAACGKVQVLVKGSLHSDELLAAVVSKSGGLRTERRISHVYAMDVPAYRKPVIVTDAAINIAPTLEHKRDICQNAVDLMRLLGRDQPKVAVLAAVETVNATMPATLDAAALTVMAARGQITGALVDGPLAFDNAISPEAVATKGIVSQVAGEADILVVPDLEAGNMLAKQLIYFAGATAAGLVLGARVPIVLTSRADPLSARIASAALAKLVAVRKAEGKA
jgi:polyhydroxyalkanoate synthase